MTTPTRFRPAPYLTPPQIAVKLGVHRATVHRWIAAGKLPAFQAGPHATALVRAEDFAEFLKGHKAA